MFLQAFQYFTEMEQTLLKDAQYVIYIKHTDNTLLYINNICSVVSKTQAAEDIIYISVGFHNMGTAAGSTMKQKRRTHSQRKKKREVD